MTRLRLKLPAAADAEALLFNTPNSNVAVSMGRLMPC
jgi:hypothetical protein